MASTSTITILQTTEWAKKFCFLRPSALGNFLEPAVTNANTILQTILGAPFAWRWNRVVVGFVCNIGQQDYFLFNWTASFAIAKGAVTVDSNGNSQLCTTAGTTGSVTPTWTTMTGGTTTDGTVIWTNSGPINTPVSQTYRFDWIEKASLQAPDPNTQTLQWKEFSPVNSLALDSAPSRPRFISPQGDDGQGNITFRLQPVPEQAYPIALILQQKPPIITGLNSTWAPIPDEYSRIYNWGFLALMLLFSDDPRFQTANQKFVTALLSASQGLTQTQINIWLNQWQAVTGQQITDADKLQQGTQARGV
jgi:hypothetical protein